MVTESSVPLSADAARSPELQALLDAAVDAVILIDHCGHIEVFNRAAERLFGWSASEVVGHNIAILMPRRDGRLHDDYIRRYIDTGEPRIIGAGREVEARRRDGTVFPAFLSVGRIPHMSPPRFVGFIQDITKRRAIEQSMERTRALLQEAQSIARMGNYEFHDDGDEEDYVSPEVYNIFGLDPEGEPLNLMRMAALVHPDDLNMHMPHWQQSADGVHTFEYRIIRPDGRTRHLQARHHVSRLPDGRRRVAGTVLDVTETRRAEEQRRRAHERMTHVSRLATMGEMAAGIAHELNQPLAAITTYAQAASRFLTAPRPDIGEVNDALRQIAAQALRAGEIIHRLRGLVRRGENERTECDINDVITELRTLALTDARMHEVRLHLDLAPELPPVSIDRIEIQQVFLNLLRNAIEALGEVPASSREIHVRSARVSRDEIEVSISDSGPGVDAGIAWRMFDPFCTTRPFGTGLGLAISRTIVQAHRGELGYRPNTPQGACFYFRLPVSTQS